MVLSADRVTWDSIQVGDELPQVVKQETQETINEYWRLAQDRRKNWKSLHMDEQYARERTIFGATVNMGVATVGYCAEMLQRAFPLKSIFAPGARLEMKATNPIHAGDTVTLSGRVAAKREESGQRLVDVEFTGVNQLGVTVAAGRATLVL